MKHRRTGVAIVGGGITGLSAAFYLQKAIQERGLSLDFTLIEANDRLGGKIQTGYRDGFVMEAGPDSFLARKQAASELVQDLGLEGDLVRNETGQAYILYKDQLHPIPQGAVMGIPTEPGPFLASRLISPAGKVRTGLDLVLPRSPQESDQSVGRFFKRRLGDEVVNRLVEPLLSGIYAADLDQLSLMATFPQFRQLETKYRSLIVAMKESRPVADRQVRSKPQGKFLTLTSGLQSLVTELENRFPVEAVVKGTGVECLQRDEEGYTLHLRDGRTIQAGAVMMATPAQTTSHMIPDPEIAAALGKINATSVANVVLAFPEHAVSMDYEGTGFVVPRNAGYTITACTWTHKKWPHTTPEGKVLLRCYVGRAGDEAIVGQSDAHIVQAVLRDMQRVVRITGDPDFYAVNRWQAAMPRYEVGHLANVRTIRDMMQARFPGVVLAGSSFEGVGLPDCIEQGKAAVQDILQYREKIL